VSVMNDKRVLEGPFNAHKSFRGFTLISPVEGKQVELVDMKGATIHRWNLPNKLGTHAVLLSDGNLLCGVCLQSEPLLDFEGSVGKLIELDWESNVVWEYEDSYMHHDFCRMSNGNTVMIRWVETPYDTAVKVKGGIPGTERDGIMWSDCLREVNRAGDTVWEWQSYEHLNPDIDIICPLCYRNEWTHANSIDLHANGKILMSFLKTNSIAIVDKATGTIEWRWGGFLKLAHPHHVAWMDNGNVMVIGCGGHIAGTEVGDSELLEIDPKTDNIVWDFKEANSTDFYSPCKAGFSLLPNGNILVSEGDKGRLFEVTVSREIVWEFVNQDRTQSKIYGANNMLFASYRYGHSYSYGNLKGNADIGTPDIRLKNEPRGQKELSEEEKIIQTRLANLGY